MKKKKKDNLTLDYESDCTYAQKLNRGKRSRAGISVQNFAARLLAIMLMVMCSLFLIVPLAALTIYSPKAIAAIAATVIVTFAIVCFIRAVAKRGKLVRTLKKTKKGKAEWISKPYGRLFSSSGKTDFVFETDRSVFEVMIVPTIIGSRSLAISSSADVICRISPMPLGKIGRLIGFKQPIRARNFRFETTGRDYGEKTLKKVIVLCPSPREFYIAHKENGKEEPQVDIGVTYAKGTNIKGNLAGKTMMIVGGEGAAPQAKDYSFGISGTGETIKDFTIENISSLARLTESVYEYDE